MTHLCVFPIVEGDGEVAAVRVLLTRVAGELLQASAEVLQPLRVPRTKLLPGRTGDRRINESELQRALDLASVKLKYADPSAVRFALLLYDGDDDLPCVLGPALLDAARRVRGDLDVACVIARREYETWFVAAADSLVPHLNLDKADAACWQDPEGRAPGPKARGKKWIEDRFRRPSYSEPVDQPRLTAAMDLQRCRERSASFDKLVRELARRLSPAAEAPGLRGSL